MADQEITDLTSAGTLDGTESLVVSQAGDSRKLTTGDLMAVVNVLTALTSPAKEDKVALYDATASAARGMTLANLFAVINDLTAISTAAVADSLVAYDADGSVAGSLTIQKLLNAINVLTADSAPDITADSILAYDAGGGAAKKLPLNLVPPVQTPGGRLTLTTGTPVLTSSTTGGTTIYYTPYVGNTIQLYDGTVWVTYTFSELSQALTDSTKSPAAATTNTNYDMFVWVDSGTLRCTRGPAWSSDTARATDIERVNGVYVNAGTITNGPAAQRGTYVGTIRTNGTSTVDMMVGAPTAAAGGTANLLGVWNMYNRVQVGTVCRDSTNSWNYTLAAFRSANNSTSNRVTFVLGLNEDAIEATVVATSVNATASVRRSVAVGLDSTSSPVDGCIMENTDAAANDYVPVKAQAAVYAGAGCHYAQWLESSEPSGTTAWGGDLGSTTLQSGLIFKAMM